jgi:hypothetical protein
VRFSEKGNEFVALINTDCVSVDELEFIRLVRELYFIF